MLQQFLLELRKGAKTMWRIILNTTKEVLANNFKTLSDADEWHDHWLDTLPNNGDDDQYRVSFEKY